MKHSKVIDMTIARAKRLGFILTRQPDERTYYIYSDNYSGKILKGIYEAVAFLDGYEHAERLLQSLSEGK